MGEEVKQTFKEVAKTIFPVTSMPSVIKDQIPTVRTENFVFCACITNRTRPRPDPPSRPLVTFNAMKFLEELARKKTVRDFVVVLKSNAIFFKLKSQNAADSGHIINNTVLCVGHCALKDTLIHLEESEAFGSQYKCSLRAFIALRKKVRRLFLRSLRRIAPHLESD